MIKIPEKDGVRRVSAEDHIMFQRWLRGEVDDEGLKIWLNQAKTGRR